MFKTLLGKVAMAIFHFHGDFIGKSRGDSAVAAAAYRAGESLYNERLGMQFDYSRKRGVDFSEILLPEHSPEWANDRQTLWNKVELFEKRKDACFCRDLKMALPCELSLSQNKTLLREYLQTQFVDLGMVADYAIHDADSHNPHAHVMLTLRRFQENSFGNKAREWNDKSLFESWREQWAEVTNRHLALNGFSQRIDHRSYEEQGIPLEPTIHRGPKVEHNGKGENLDRAQQAYEVQQRNFQRLLKDPSIAIDFLSHHESVFNHQELSKFVNYRTSSVEEFNQLKLAIESCEELVNLGTGADGKQYYTSKTVLKREHILQETAKELSQSRRHQLNAARFEPIARNLGLKKEQKEAFDFILSGHDLSLIVGFAGTGKGYLMNAVREAYESQGYQVRGVALAGKAADGLAQSAHIPTKTIARSLLDWENQRDTLNHKTVLIVDEAGMIGTRQLQLLLTEAEKTKAKIILCGDPEQIPSIEASSPFRYLLERMPHKFLKTIIRQEVEWQRKATLQLSTRRHGEALDQYKTHRHVHMSETRTEALERLVKEWYGYSKSNPDKDAIMMAYRNSDVAMLNESARSYLKEDKRLSQESLIERVDRGEIYLAEGERLLFLRNENSLTVKNGQLATISKLKKHIITVEMDRGDTLSFDTRDYQDFTYGYAATVHKLQGATVDQSFVLATPHFNRFITNVALDRHRHGVEVYYGQDDFKSYEQFKQRLSRGESKVLAIEFAEARGFDYGPEKDSGLHTEQAQAEHDKEINAVIQSFVEMDKKLKEAEQQPYAFHRTSARETIEHYVVEFAKNRELLESLKKQQPALYKRVEQVLENELDIEL